jgi:twitching motility protein PilT
VSNTPYADENFFRQLLSKAVAAKASDVHLKVGQPPGARIRGDMIYFKTDKILPADTEAVARIVLREQHLKEHPEEITEHDGSYSAPGIGRFRVNVYRQRGTLAVVMRHIVAEIPDMESLGLPWVAKDLAEKPFGMALLCGGTGTGKSTSIAAMIGHLNKTRALHIVTIEDPLEYLHKDGTCSLSQREVGFDTKGFAPALRAALRQDPDVIFLGEIRDEETMEISLKAAETGHLLLSTLHTNDAMRTVNRMLALMKGDVQENRLRIAGALQGIIAQRLLPRADGRGVVLAAEVLIGTTSVKEAIRRPEGNPSLKVLMEKGVHPYGMQTFQMHVDDLLAKGIIDDVTAREALGQ